MGSGQNKGFMPKPYLEGKLVSFDKMDPEVQREIARKGGIASGEAKRKRNAMKKQMNAILEVEITNKNKKALLKKMGLEDSQMNNQMMMLLALFQKACMGEVAAIREVREIVGNYGIAEDEEDNEVNNGFIINVVNANSPLIEDAWDE